jgi:hypothetical protein
MRAPRVTGPEFFRIRPERGERMQGPGIEALQALTLPREASRCAQSNFFCAGWVLEWGDGRPSGSNPMSPSSLPSPHPSNIALDRDPECGGSLSRASRKFAGDRDARAESDMGFERVALAPRCLGIGARSRSRASWVALVSK